MPAPQTTYSFKDLVGVLTSPAAPGPITIAGGNIGIGQLTIRMLTQRTEHDVAADGVVMTSYIPGQNAEVTIETQQTSGFHHALLGLYNAIVTASDNGDISNWASLGLSLRTVLDGAGHFLTGGSFQKIGDKPYMAKGGRVTWVLMFADAVNQ